MKQEKKTMLTLEFKDYDETRLIDALATSILQKSYEDGIRISNQIEKRIGEIVKDDVTQIVSEKLNQMVDSALDHGVLTSEPWDEEEQRSPIRELVKTQVHNFLTSKDRSFGGNGTQLDRMMRDIIGIEVKRETENALKEIKTKAVQDARTNIAKTISERLFDGKALPF